MNTVLSDLKENPLWAYRVSSYSNESSGLSCDKLLKKWNFHRYVRKVIKDKHITEFFPIQEKIIPLLLNNTYKDRLSVFSCDFIITAPTGQGKTLCYVLPLINNILNLKENRLSALIIAPSRELVKQIYEVFSWFIDSDPLTYDLKGNGLKVRLFYGDKSFIKYHRTILNDPPHIAITTPGILVEYFIDFDKNHFYNTFSHLKWIVIEEVDLMLNQPLFEWVNVVVDLVNTLKRSESNQCSGLPQKILVSATVPLKSHEIDTLDLNRPILFRLDEIIFKLPKNLTQNCISTSKRSRPLVLIKLLNFLFFEKESGNVLVFFSKVDTCHTIARLLQIYVHQTKSNFKAMEFNSKLSQKDRNRVMNTYKKEGKICLLCSDVASRGIDLPNTTVVVSYDVPIRLSTYIHRAGRTARANNEGNLYVFVSKKDQTNYNRFMNKLKVERSEINNIDPNGLMSEQKSNKLKEIYPKLVENGEKCLDLESSGKIKYHSELKESWYLIDS
ncbi:ATP-dependent RNA helicase [Theileria orientalis strain Shintoku]|uniref:ATP-dependent RNA helicase n=1 Tax=Theileria orientalis strain Shintoku TaxID=869250 RepID=J4DNF5_THEOR|nr:ATP-dependent RNA helicase [Theileria orientalis strain Shintoku]BAM38869.1 ATP-dependent RNA helicase [Theileria orientalis strain Shintoku]|eukprot:XP_009689170.1 ATP-dependent RNA helicase [Theileria orientalis strain Shintoku]